MKWDVLQTVEQIYCHSAKILMEVFQSIPESIRSRFETEGFRIKMTEWDITEETYAPYGGNHETRKVRTVFDFERKMLYANDRGQWFMKWGIMETIR